MRKYGLIGLLAPPTTGIAPTMAIGVGVHIGDTGKLSASEWPRV